MIRYTKGIGSGVFIDNLTYELNIVRIRFSSDYIMLWCPTQSGTSLRRQSKCYVVSRHFASYTCDLNAFQVITRLRSS